MQDLTVQIGDLHLVRIGDAEGPDAGGREVEPDRRTQTAGPEQENFGLAQT
jgi:hypothetical protein